MENTEKQSSSPRFTTVPAVMLQTLEIINAGVAVLDAEGYFIYVNGKYGEIYGFSRDALIGNHYLMLIPKKGRQKYLRGFDELEADSNGRKTGETRLQRKDRSIIDIQFSTQNIETEIGMLTIVTVNDISNIKDIQHELNTNESKYRSMMASTAAKGEENRKLIMNAALDAIICFQADGSITQWNPQAEKIFGWNVNEARKLKISRIMTPEAWHLIQSSGIEAGNNTGTAFNKLLNVTAIDRSGRSFPIEITILPIRHDEEIEFYCSFIRDITERKETEMALQQLNAQMASTIEELAKSNSELEHFAYIASHDLQEPLRMVTNFLGQLEKKYDDKLDDRGRQYLHFAVDGAIRMRKIILDLLEYSRIGKVEQRPVQVDIAQVVAEVVEIHKSVLNESRGKVLYGNLPVILANPTSIRQLFQNLIGNALKYRPLDVPPKIQVRCEDDGDFWMFSVTDNGIGIESMYFERIFEIFQRLHNREQYSGTGIGLAICKKIVDSYGGRIWVDSEPGKGSTFSFTIKK